MTRDRKRSLFAIEVPEEQLDAEGLELKLSAERRAPMAIAVKENFAALDNRRQLDIKIRQENDDLAHEFVRLKKLGLVVDEIPLDSIDCQSMMRDRIGGQDLELEELELSIQEIGLSNPIRVRRVEQGRYELVQGMRRLAAYRSLYNKSTTLAERGVWNRIPAAFFSTNDDLATSYRQMVDENLIRKDVSFGEMARLALHYADDLETNENDVDAAVATLFKAAAYSKRSHIRAFAQLLSLLGDSLAHPEAIPRNLGLDVRKRLVDMPESLEALKLALNAETNANAEITTLRSFVDGRLVKNEKKHKNSREISSICQIKLPKSGSRLACDWRQNHLSIKGKMIGQVGDARLRRALEVFAAELESLE